MVFPGNSPDRPNLASEDEIGEGGRLRVRRAFPRLARVHGAVIPRTGTLFGGESADFRSPAAGLCPPTAGESAAGLPSGPSAECVGTREAADRPSAGSAGTTA